jgi:hypothetical protein
MFFDKRFLMDIIEGRKTVTRRAWKGNHVKVGKIYKVCRGYTKDYYFELRITGIDWQSLGMMTEDDAEKEGFKKLGKLSALTQFMAYWTYTHGEFTKTQTVQVITFELRSPIEWARRHTNELLKKYPIKDGWVID